MVRRLYATGYEDFQKTLSDLYNEKEPPHQVNIYFHGTKDDKDVSWCSDCNKAYPYVKKAVEEFADENSVFLEVDVGDRTAFKDMKNQFRTDKKVALMVVPTLLRWKSVVRLQEGFCTNMDDLELFFKAEKDLYHLPSTANFEQTKL